MSGQPGTLPFAPLERALWSRHVPDAVCDRCGTDSPPWDVHMAEDGNDVCSDCCDVCTDESEGQTMNDTPMSGVLSASQHWWAHGVTAEVDTRGAGPPILHVRTADWMGRIALSGTVDDLRAVGWAILAALDEMGE